ncbi:MFS transporter [Thermobifida halotolerans]|uniref:MFS transporter n=2 Tax=Thermobifida halotolerans TaxID=483545 RepID=A0AA97M6A1_9ACTN|nr:MFS transporter [Thermobifida halotolerans]UOE21986.1 MFS transporter [Thermobifida halotolerans]
MCAVVLALSGPGQTAGISILIDHFIADLDISRSAVSTAYLVGTLSGALALPWLGRAVDRFGVRPVLALVAVAFGAFLTLLATAQELVGLTAAFVGVRAMGQGGMTLVSTTAVAVAVTRGRGTALGVTTAVGTAGISLVPLLGERAVAEFGWRWTVLGEAALIWAVVLPIAAWGLRGVRHGAREQQETADSSPDGTGAAGTTWPLRAVVRTSMFWVVTSAVACSGLVSTAVYFHQIALLGERGLSTAQAAANFLPQTVAGLAASFLFSAAADRFSPKLLIFCSMALQAGALAMLPLVSPGVTAVLYGVSLGAAASGARSVEAVAFPHYYGTGVIGSLRGLTQSVAVASTAVAPLLLSFGRDLADSYLPAVLALAVLPALVALATPFARSPVPRGE